MMSVRAHRLRRLERDAAEIRADRMSEGHVHHDALAGEEGADAPVGPIEELVGHHHVQRRVLLLEAADRAGREDPLDAQKLESEDVGAEVELRRRDPVTGPVPREKRHATPTQRRGHIGSARVAERRRQPDLLAVRQLLHVVEPTPADDADLDRHAPPLRTPRAAQAHAPRLPGVPASKPIMTPRRHHLQPPAAASPAAGSPSAGASWSAGAAATSGDIRPSGAGTAPRGER